VTEYLYSVITAAPDEWFRSMAPFTVLSGHITSTFHCILTTRFVFQPNTGIILYLQYTAASVVHYSVLTADLIAFKVCKQ